MKYEGSKSRILINLVVRKKEGMNYFDIRKKEGQPIGYLLLRVPINVYLTHTNIYILGCYSEMKKDKTVNEP